MPSIAPLLLVLLCLISNFPPPTFAEDFSHTTLPPLQPISSHSNLASSLTYSFTDSTSGWTTNAASTETHAHIYSQSGSLHIAITSPNPHLDSPPLLLRTDDRHTIALRYKYSGQSTVGKFTLRGNTASDATNPVYVDYHDIVWEASGSSTDFFEDIYYPVIGDGQWHTTYASFQTKVNGTLTRFFDETLQQIRMHPVTQRDKDEGIEASPAPKAATAFIVDWIEVVSAPAVERVTGCNGEQYHSTIDFSTWPEESFQLTQETLQINDHLSHHKTLWERRAVSNPTTFGRVYNCLRTGGETITVEGRNFGELGAAHVFIGSNPCTSVVHDAANPQTSLTCVTPPYNPLKPWSDSLVTVRHGKLPGLNDTVPFFKYAIHAPPPVSVSLSNVAATSIDVSWGPGGDIWDHMTVTGYEISYRTTGTTPYISYIVGNVTTTTIIDLTPGQTYDVVVAASVEDQDDLEWQAMDKYGRRDLLSHGLLSDKTAPVSTTTVDYDFDFPRFTAESSIDAGATLAAQTLGPTGVTGGEGHYGLYIIGDANIENCNSSVVCCDDYDYDTMTCPSAALACSATVHPNPQYVNGEGDRRVPDNLAGGEKWVVDQTTMAPLKATAKCGPALRLTASEPRLSGSAWYQREQEVGEGFDTKFTFRVANPSLRCDVMDDVNTNCRARGADGFAFVIQEDGVQALGEAGESLGYGGITNSLAVEFDTYYNPELLEPYENHISVHTRGHRHPNSPDQTYSLGHTNEVRDLTEGIIEVRVRYEPTFDERELANPHFVSSPYVAHFLENADFKNGGQADWSVGMGLLYVYVENLDDPVLIVPLNMEATLNLNHGRAWVGFTAATGFNTWQVHDILDWRFTSMRRDNVKKDYVPSPVVNGENAFKCSGVNDAVDCRHQ